jgi:hypothetical protein
MKKVGCPKCGGTFFRAIEGGSYTEKHYIDGEHGVQWTEGQEQDRNDHSSWECLSCDKEVSQATARALSRAEEEYDWQRR